MSHIPLLLDLLWLLYPLIQYCPTIILSQVTFFYNTFIQNIRDYHVLSYYPMSLLSLIIYPWLSYDPTIYPLLINIDPENHLFVMETNLPTPFSGRVYVNLLESIFYEYRISLSFLLVCQVAPIQRHLCQLQSGFAAAGCAKALKAAFTWENPEMSRFLNQFSWKKYQESLSLLWIWTKYQLWIWTKYQL